MRHLFVILITLLALPLGCSQDATPASSLFGDFSVPRVAPSPGCASPTSGGMAGTITMPPGSAVATRNYRVDAPTWWDGTTPIPVVYYFHGCGGSEQSGGYNGLYYRSAQAQWLSNGVDPYDSLVVIGASAGTCWDVAPEAEDLPYTQLLREAVESTYCVDEERRYHGGISSGAFAAQAFACRLGDVAATFAAAGGMHHEEGNPYDLTPTPLPEVSDCQGPVPFFGMHGTGDTIVPIDTFGRPARDRWLEINGCDEQSAAPYDLLVPAADGAAAPDPGTACEGLSDCSCSSYTCTGAPTVWCEHSGGHNPWPPYHRDAAVNWFGQFISDLGGSTSTGSDSTGSTSVGTDATGTASTAASGSTSPGTASSTTCEMVCQCI